ncbi:MAG: DUF1385 domain-containing protein, partial [Lachnospiraceae bacterium]|nr:DUF1385 domain-containing protein [Lachnospiraceae bacterium]
AGISYEFIRFAGKSDNVISNLLSAPGLWLQRLTTKEPDDEMIEVAIAAVEAVFDWKDYLKKTFDYDVDAYLGLKEYDLDDLEEADGSDDMDVSEEIAAMEAQALVAEETEASEDIDEVNNIDSDLIMDPETADTETDFDSDMKEIRFADEGPEEN